MIPKRNRILLQLKRPTHTPVDITIIPDTLASGISSKRSVVVGGLIFEKIMEEKMGQMKKRWEMVILDLKLVDGYIQS